MIDHPFLSLLVLLTFMHACETPSRSETRDMIRYESLSEYEVDERVRYEISLHEIRKEH
jgi:hypothetical protein